jgi:hypothetical protein
MRTKKRGSALLFALIIGSILLLTLSALIGTAMSELRNATRSAMNSMAFSLAEAGIDRATITIRGGTTGDSFSATDSAWTSSSSTTYTRTFTADKASLGGMTGYYKVVVTKSSSTATESVYNVYSKGSVTNAAGALTAARAIQVTVTRKTVSGTGSGLGCASKSSFTAGTGGNISSTQIGPTFDAYSSNYGSSTNTAPSTSNRSNKCTVGTDSTVNGALNLSNGRYYCTVGTSHTDANLYPSVGYSTANGVSLATIDKASTTFEDQTAYDGTTGTESLLSRTVEVSVPDMIPTTASDSGWTIVTPGTDTNSNSQYKQAGKISQFPGNSAVSCSSNILSIGASDSSKTYLTSEGLDNVSSINVSGEVVLVINGPINSNSLTVNFKTTNAKLSIYTNNNIGGVVLSTLLVNGSTVQNWEADRLSLFVLPSSATLSGNAYWDGSKTVSPTPSAIAANAQTAVTTAGKSTTAGTSITMNFDSTAVFVGKFIAPFSAVQLSATGTQRGSGTGKKMSDFCGQLVAGSILINGSTGFAFHFDQALADASDSTPQISYGEWAQIPANKSVFN